jgi:antitoxin (DNA-binding transcriptional repressor) of toxin-antitoxin stability system
MEERSIGLNAARPILGDLAADTARGIVTVLTSHRHPLARIVPIEPETEAAREAMALVAEWIWQMRATDDAGWRESYSPADAARVAAELDKIRDRFEEYGPSAFHRRAQEVRANA